MPRPADEYIPQVTADRRPLIIWLTVAAIGVLLMTLIVGAPLARASGHQTFAYAVYGAFGKLCHQMPDRSFFVAGRQFAVCSRCTGLYLGFMVVTLCYPLLRSLRSTDTPPRAWLFLAALPLALDFSLGFLGIWENTHLSRFLTGALLSSVAVFYIIPGLVQLNLKDIREVFRGNAEAIH
ncbi:MAG TPA: DUF2085 domain-containing protein [Pyrinomonadaceae bacterium]|nr:DUF2085 domain-containing protein [Pyrinomonadaceae bacterium]